MTLEQIPFPIDFTVKQETFTHKDDDGVFRRFPVESMLTVARKWADKCAEVKTIKMKLLPANGRYIRSTMGIEPARLKRLVQPWLDIPAIGILWDQNRLTFVDGNHRYIRRLQAGYKWMQVYAFQRDLWEQMLIPLPAEPEGLLSKPSGMIEREAAAKVSNSTGLTLTGEKS